MKFLYLNPLSSTPQYLQIAKQLEDAITSGTLKHLDKLPSESFFERVYRVSPIVVKQAYAILKEKKLIETGRGTQAYVSIRKKHKLHYEVFSSGNSSLLSQHAKLLFSTIRSLSTNESYDFFVENALIIETKRLFILDGFPVYYQVNMLLDNQMNKSIPKELDLNVGIFSLNSMLTKYMMNHIELLYYPKKATQDVAAILEIENNDAIHFFKYLHIENQSIVGVSYHYMPGQYVDLIRED